MRAPSLTTLQAIELRYAVPALEAAALALGNAVEARWTRTQQPQQQQLPACEERAAAAGSGDGGSGSVWRQRYAGALAKAATLAYSTVLSTTFQLLHCVSVDGAQVVFRAATVRCGAWQVPLCALAAALLLPVVVALAAAATGASEQLLL